MPRLLTLLVSTALSGLVLTGPVAAQSPAVSLALRYLQVRVTPGATLRTYLERYATEFRGFDADGDGAFTEADVVLHEAVASAAARTGALLMTMRADLDGDGAVTADEVRRLYRYERRTVAPGTAPPAAPQYRSGQPTDEHLDFAVRQSMAADSDGDGRVTLSEALAHQASKQQAEAGSQPVAQTPWRANYQLFLVFDANGDGRITLAELEAAAEAVFGSIDADGNGIASAEEIKAAQGRLEQPTAEARQAAQEAARKRDQERREAEAARQKVEQEARAACAMPKASDRARVMVLGAYETEALSTAAIGSQDRVTHAGDVTVEPGDEPVYVVVATYASVVWRFSGAVDRIERVVLGSRSGAAGLPADRVTMLTGGDCLGYFSEAPSIQAAKAAGAVARETGKTPAGVFGRYEVGGFTVPSGRIGGVTDPNKPQVLIIQKSAGTLTIEGDPRGVIVQTPSTRNLERELLRFNPGGVIDVDPAAVVARLPVTRYEVLPQQAGLIQLVQQGALSQNRGGEFLIHRKMRFPAGLAGAHSVKFLLLRGVPLPDGDPAHSAVVSEETGEAIKFGKKS